MKLGSILVSHDFCGPLNNHPPSSTSGAGGARPVLLSNAHLNRLFPPCHPADSSRNLQCEPLSASEKESVMARVLVIHGAGMNMRGKVQTEIFGPMTLPEYDERIRGYAGELGVEIELFHSNIEGDVINKLYDANDRGLDAAVFNPAGFSRGYPALVAAIGQVKFPTIELHISNPVRRGPVSETATVSQGMVTGFGIAGYYLALRGLRDMLAK